MAKVSRNAPILSVSVAAELAGMHAQTVRQYDRLGLVVASRTRGGGRRYRLNDVDKLIEIQRLSQEEGVSLSGIAHIFKLREKLEKLERARKKLERENQQLRETIELMHEKLNTQSRRQNRVFAAGSDGEVLVADRLESLRQQLRSQLGSSGQDMVLWQPRATLARELFKGSLFGEVLFGDDAEGSASSGALAGNPGALAGRPESFAGRSGSMSGHAGTLEAEAFEVPDDADRDWEPSAESDWDDETDADWEESSDWGGDSDGERTAGPRDSWDSDPDGTWAGDSDEDWE